MSNTTRIARNIAKAVLSREQMDGDGARVFRSIGTPALKNLDPFLMLDEFDVKAPGGFPDHPHRGFETVTYMLEGQFLHEDFAGHAGRIGPGDLQWMTAGKGIVHAEIPENGGRSHGLQLWVNLAAKDKMIDPQYQELPKEKVQSVKSIDGKDMDGIEINVIAGESYGTKSPVLTRTPTMFIDVKLKKGKYIEQDIPAEFTGFIYSLAGKARFGGEEAVYDAHHTLVFSNNKGTYIPVTSESDDCHFVIIAGKPIGEKVVQYGPFVMNTEEQIYEAFQDYRQGRNGFEGASEWVSKIRDKWRS